MSSINSALLSRLRKDLTELAENPYPGINIYHHDAKDLHEFCLHLEPSSGPFAGLRLHFDVTLPSRWPHQPPQIKSSCNISHPNVIGQYICCDLLKPASYTATGGYTPAFTLRGLLLQFLSFFSSEAVEQDSGDSVLLGNRGEPLEAYQPIRYNNGIPDLNPHPQNSVNPKQQAELKAAWEKESDCGQRALGVMVKFPYQVKEPVAAWWPTQTEGLGTAVKLVWMNNLFDQTLSTLKRFKCSACGYGTRKFPYQIPENFHPVARPYTFPPGSKFYDPPSISERTFPRVIPPPQKVGRGQNHLEKLSVELLLSIADLLPLETLNLFSLAYPRFSTIVRYHRIHLCRELSCFFLRKPITNRSTILGVGVHYDSSTGFLKSNFDWLSYAAFQQNIRHAVDKSPITHFLPLAFGSIHFERVVAKDELWPHLEKLAEDVIPSGRRGGSSSSSRGGRGGGNSSSRGSRGGGNSSSRGGRGGGQMITPAPESPKQLCLRVLYKMCNSLVVQLMNTSDAALSSTSPSSEASKTLLFASEKICIGYLQLYHLLLSILNAYPDLRAQALHRLKAFRSTQSARTKSATPDLGELLVCCAAVAGSAKDGAETISWPTELLPTFLREVLTRNVLWLLRAHPELELLEVGVSKYRHKTTFEAAKTSFRLVMFQTLFWESFIVPHMQNPEKLERYFGFPEPGSGVAEGMVAGIREIYAVKTWTGFFKKIGFQEGLEKWIVDGGKQLCKELRWAVERSQAEGYHRRARESLYHRRKLADPSFVDSRA